VLIKEMAWMGTYSDKLDRFLQDELTAYYHAIRKAPGLLRTLMGPVISRKQFPVIIQACSELTEEEVSAIQGLVASQGGSIDQILPMVNGVSTRINIDAIQKLVSHDHIERIHLDRPVRALLDIAEPTIKTPLVWSQSRLTGKGVTIAIVDTGIYPHPDLTKPSNRILAFKDFVGGNRQPYDDNGHGTHCAGNAAGNGYRSNGKFRGTAPEARLVGVKVLDRNGAALLSKVVAGVQWCVDNRNRFGIRIISLSLGGPAMEKHQNDIICKAVEKAWEAGIFCCVAAGNDGPRSGTIATPGIDP
jgi:serine protease AprX